MRDTFTKHSVNGFTLLEMLVVVLIIGTLCAIAVPGLLSFANTRYLNMAQDEIYRAMRQAQSQAKKEKLSWYTSFREHNGILQWAVYPSKVNAANAHWNNLNSNVRLDSETTFKLVNGIGKVEFDYRGNAKVLGRITLSSKYGGLTKRCIIVSTILGTIRMAKEQTKAENGKYCY